MRRLFLQRAPLLDNYFFLLCEGDGIDMYLLLSSQKMFWSGIIDYLLVWVQQIPHCAMVGNLLLKHLGVQRSDLIDGLVDIFHVEVVG